MFHPVNDLADLFLLALTLVLVCTSGGSAQNSSPQASNDEPDSETRSVSIGQATLVLPAEINASQSALASSKWT